MERALTFDVVRRFPGGPVVSARASWPLESAPVTVLFGPSGSGKTTVLRALAGLDRPDDGAITFAGETWFDAARGVHVPPQACTEQEQEARRRYWNPDVQRMIRAAQCVLLTWCAG
jgi:molybdate transport system ATP-binding protein